MLRTRVWVPYLYVAPAVALLCLVFAYPVVRVVDFSTRLIRGANGPYVGSLNYRLVWEDSTFHDALKHSALLLLAVPVLLVLSIFFAVLLYERARGWRIYRSVLFLPYILAVPIVGIVASYIFELHGALNSILHAVHLNGLGGGGRAPRGLDRLDLAAPGRARAGAGGGAGVRRAVALRQTILFVAAIFALYPVWFMLSTAFKTQHQYLQNPYAVPWPLSVGNFSDALHGATFLLWFKNSAILTMGSVVLS